MKNISIKKRVTLYYSVVLIAITILVFGVFVAAIDLETSNVSKATISSVVQNAFDNIECNQDIISIDNDFDAYSKGVTMIVYGQDGSLVLGNPPSDFPASTPLVSNDYQEISGGEETWLVYDLANTYVNGETIWIRGIFAVDNGISTLESIMKIMMILLPIILLFAILAGRHITTKAFEPVAEITAAAEAINSGNDLSKRLPMQDSHDELYYLTQTLNLMIDRLEEAFKAEKQFSSDVSHELKTPMAVILAECEYTLKENRDVSSYKLSLETIQQQCEKSMALISQLLQLSRTINKEKALVKENINLSILCESIAAEMSQIARKHNISMENDITPDIEIFADETLIMRMLMNLIGNGIKYGKENGFVKLSLKTGDSGKVLICVSDNGIGIAASDQANIFNRFYKVDKSRNSPENSFGLGLSMVKWIADAHGGTLTLESQLGQGSSFIIEI